MTITRRSFLKTSAGAVAGLVIATKLPAFAADPAASSFQPNAYIEISPDNVIRLWVTRSEMGQGVRTTLPMMLAEELEVDWKQIQLLQAATTEQFKGIRLRTSGSGSTVGTYPALRKAGATAREMLIAAAAESWHVPPSACEAKQGTVVHSSTGRRLTYGQLAASAAQQQVPKDPALKPPKDFQFIGKPRKKTDGAAIVDGRAMYGIDTARSRHAVRRDGALSGVGRQLAQLRRRARLSRLRECTTSSPSRAASRPESRLLPTIRGPP